MLGSFDGNRTSLVFAMPAVGVGAHHVAIERIYDAAVVEESRFQASMPA